MDNNYDIIIIGAGVVGSSCARSLSKYDLRILVLEKNLEVGEATTKANSAIVHGGYDCKVGSLKAKLNVKGARMMEDLSKKLNFPYEKTGSLVIAFNEEERKELRTLLDKGEKNGLKDLKIISGEEARIMEPALSKEVVEALYCEGAGIVCPFNLTYAYMENAMANGVDLKLDFEVNSIEKLGDFYKVSSGGESYFSKVVINAAGVNSDKIGELVGDSYYKISPRKGEYRLLDKSEGNMVSHVIFQTPSELGKGVLVTRTVHGNLLIGPNSEEAHSSDDLKTTKEGIDYIDRLSKRSVPSLRLDKTIRVFSGLRATPDTGDFMIFESENNRGFIHVGGIESPGLASSPAIGEYVAEITMKTGLINVKLKEDFIDKREGFTNFKRLSQMEKSALIKNDPAYGRVVCRCETVTEGEILEAIRRNPGATTVDGVKRRVRPGMGRCQGGFCGPKVMEILSRELRIPVKDVMKDSKESRIVLGNTKGGN